MIFLQIVVPPQIFFHFLVVKEVPFNLAIFLRKIAIFGYDFWQIVDPLQFFLFMLRYGGWEAAL